MDVLDNENKYKKYFVIYSPSKSPLSFKGKLDFKIWGSKSSTDVLWCFFTNVENNEKYRFYVSKKDYYRPIGTIRDMRDAPNNVVYNIEKVNRPGLLPLLRFVSEVN